MTIQPSQKLSPMSIFDRQKVSSSPLSRFFEGVDFMILSNAMTRFTL
jgi:hypothetical protein